MQSIQKSWRKSRESHARKKEGTLKSGRSGKKSNHRKQAIAIGLSEARKKGAKVPKKSSTAKKALQRRVR